MFSILIPVFNYNISKLVCEIHKQASASKIKFEIIYCEDGSNKYVEKNKSTIETLSFTKSIISNNNLGRTQTRQLLSDAASYNWLLFLDADVFPKLKDFIEIYIKKITLGHQAIYGGFAYTRTKPESDFILRWKYGKTYEEVNADIRNSKPYQVIISANFIIKKDVFNKINSKINRKGYGLDNYFASLLKQNSINILHINNEVYHLGIEKSIHYLDKIEEAIKNLIWLFNADKLSIHSNKLLSIYVVLKKLRLHYLLRFLFPIFKPFLKKNLVGNNPNMILLQFYKVLYICFEDLNNK
ncbi:glycosyltransferase [Algibacter sp. R77976]|uniref:glycosyltransferase n=1 Tax=Algibacter sp. R77976 TaxID=3093873 RepID=UPI0037CA5B62